MARLYNEATAGAGCCVAAAARGAYAGNTERALHADVAIFPAWRSDVSVANPYETPAVALAVPYRFPPVLITPLTSSPQTIMQQTVQSPER
jgi:hypothetical protein